MDFQPLSRATAMPSVFLCGLKAIQGSPIQPGCLVNDAWAYESDQFFRRFLICRGGHHRGLSPLWSSLFRKCIQRLCGPMHLEAVSTPEDRVIVSKLCSVLTIQYSAANVGSAHGFIYQFIFGEEWSNRLCEVPSPSSFVSTPVQTLMTWRWNLSSPCCDFRSRNTRVASLSDSGRYRRKRWVAPGLVPKPIAVTTTSWGVRK